MANGYFERGELYWVKVSDTIGSEVGVGRPGVIISSKKGNETSPVVQVAYTTTQVKYGVINPSTYASGKKTWILCNQIQTVDKTRLERYIGKLTDAEMREVDTALEIVFDLGYKDDEEVERLKSEIEALQAKIVELTGEVAQERVKHEDELLSYKVENAMWQKCYEKALTQIVDMKYTNDLFLKNHLGRKAEEAPKIEEPKPAKVVDPDEPVITPKSPEEPELPVTLLDINSCTSTALKKAGFSLAMARKIVEGRPYKSVADLKNLNGMKTSLYRMQEPKLCCNPLPVVEPEPVEQPKEPETPEITETVDLLDINACLAKELHERTGVALSTAYCITSYRRANGPFKNLDELLNVRQVFPGTVDKIRGKVKFGPGITESPVVRKKKEVVVEPYTGEKVNINTASAKEIHDITGLDMTVCYGITGRRKREGNYSSVEDLRNVPRFTDYHWAKYSQMFEV